jgi:pyruvate dehydrogenase E2 component (dihydrolipoamide acetyltransferase)
VAFEVTMPQMGADMTEGTLVRWLKQVGERVERGDIIAEIETDKATVELEAYDGGTLIKQVAAEGEVVPVGDVIALLGEESEAAPDVERKPPAETPARRTIQPAAGGTSPASQPGRAREPAAVVVASGAPSNGRIRISPVAKRIANQAGVDIAMLVGSGPDGRILRKDVEAAIARPPAAAVAAAPAVAPAPQAPVARAVPAAAAPAGTEPLSKMRQAIARRMTLSKETQPHYYLTLDVDMTAAMQFRETLNASATDAQHVSVNDLIVKACAIALERHPRFNAEFTEAGLKMHVRVNIDIGIALDDGLIAPAVLDCGSKSLGRIAIESKDLVNRAKSGHLRADEYSDGTFTITNLGAYGVEALIGIINPPQAAILGVGSVMDQPVARNGEVKISKVMKVALSADHRVTDGAEGARFIKEIQGLLENPVSLAL